VVAIEIFSCKWGCIGDFLSVASGFVLAIFCPVATKILF
jgi:hypothetical protein